MTRVDAKVSAEWKSMESFLAQLESALANQSAIVAKLADDPAMLAEVTTVYDNKLIHANNTVSGIRDNIAALNTKMKDDPDISVEDKAEFEAAKTNEV